MRSFTLFRVQPWVKPRLTSYSFYDKAGIHSRVQAFDCSRDCTELLCKKDNKVKSVRRTETHADDLAAPDAAHRFTQARGMPSCS